MEKKATNFLLILALSAIVIIITNLLFPKRVQEVKKEQPQTTTPYPTVEFSLPNIPEEEKIEISGVEMKNFYKKAISVGQQIGDTLIVSNVEYNITYYPLDEAFLIVILRWPFDEIREKAEQDFLESLTISKEQACKLAVYITTPRYANPEYAGNNWRLSWCE